MLTLKVVQAKFGDCMILKFGDSQKPHYMLIDGGPGGTYRDHLRHELEKISSAGGQLDLVVLSQYRRAPRPDRRIKRKQGG